MQESIFYKQVGERLRKVREERNMSREHLAELSDISTKFLYEIENGKKGLSGLTLHKVCRALQIPSDYLLEGIGENTNQTRIEYMVRNFSQEEMDYVLKVIEGIYGFWNQEHSDKIG